MRNKLTHISTEGETYTRKTLCGRRAYGLHNWNQVEARGYGCCPLYGCVTCFKALFAQKKGTSQNAR